MMKGVQPKEDRTAQGVAMMALAVALFTCIDTSAKWLMIFGLPALQVVFARYVGHLAYALLFYLPQEGLSALRSHSPRLQLFRSLCLMGSTILNFMALSYLPITVTTTIQFAMPIVVTLLAIPMLGETVGIRLCRVFGGAVGDPTLGRAVASGDVSIDFRCFRGGDLFHFDAHVGGHRKQCDAANLGFWCSDDCAFALCTESLGLA
jgi:hypothetical protein